MQVIKTFFFMVVFVLIVSFITQNQWMLNENQFIQFTFYGYRTFPLSIPLIMAFCVLMGASIASFSVVLTHIRQKQLLKKQRKTIKLMEKELNELRNLPITEIEGDIKENAASKESME